MSIDEVAPSDVRELWRSCSEQVELARYADKLNQAVLDGLYGAYSESVVLARAFMTVPYSFLPDRQNRFASMLAEKVGRPADLRPDTPVLCLLATRGRAEAWNHPERSSGHVAIPLLSKGFVQSIPMVSQLLISLGVPLTWKQDGASTMLGHQLGVEAGCFHVADATHAVDHLGRKIIPDQDFVKQHGVRSVFAVGGSVGGGAVLVLILFTQVTIGLRTVRTFMPLANLIKSALALRYSPNRVFCPETG